MPLFLPKDLELKWLDASLGDEQLQEILNYEMAADALDYNPVYTIRTTKERPDGKGKLEIFQWPDLPPLGIDTIEQTLF